jgi:hypothetical protein
MNREEKRKKLKALRHAKPQKTIISGVEIANEVYDGAREILQGMKDRGSDKMDGNAALLCLRAYTSWLLRIGRLRSTSEDMEALMVTIATAVTKAKKDVEARQIILPN